MPHGDTHAHRRPPASPRLPRRRGSCNNPRPAAVTIYIKYIARQCRSSDEPSRTHVFTLNYTHTHRHTHAYRIEPYARSTRCTLVCRTVQRTAMPGVRARADNRVQRKQECSSLHLRARVSVCVRIHVVGARVCATTALSNYRDRDRGGTSLTAKQGGGCDDKITSTYRQWAGANIQWHPTQR